MAQAQAAPEVDRPQLSAREARRLETRARIFDAAVAEMCMRGLAGADVTAIANAAGVVRGTFYFHFPTKEHVLAELQLREEAAIVAGLRGMRASADDVESTLTLLVSRILDVEERLGTVVFRDMLGIQFSSSRPADLEFAEHPVAQFIVETITKGQRANSIPADADPAELAVFFGTGTYALLAAGVEDRSTLSRYVTTIVKGMETR